MLAKMCVEGGGVLIFFYLLRKLCYDQALKALTRLSVFSV